MVQHPHQTNKPKVPDPTKKHIVLTTGSLLGKRVEWGRLARRLSAGGFLIVLPAGYIARWGFIARMAQNLKASGRDVEIHTV
jgi:hypothetical protein